MSDVKKEKKVISVESMPTRIKEALQKVAREAAEPIINSIATSEDERLLEWFRAYRYGLYDVIPDKKEAYNCLERYIALSISNGNSRKNVLKKLHEDFRSGTDKLQSNDEDAQYIYNQLDAIYADEAETRLGCLGFILIVIAIWYFWPSSDEKKENTEPIPAVEQQQKKEEAQSTPDIPKEESGQIAVKALITFHENISKHKWKEAGMYWGIGPWSVSQWYEELRPDVQSAATSTPYDIQVTEQSQNQVRITYFLQAVDNSSEKRIFIGKVCMEKLNGNWVIKEVTLRSKNRFQPPPNTSH